MSLINDMLLDLDRRAAPIAAPAGVSLSVADERSPVRISRPSRQVALVTAAAVVAGVVVVAGYLSFRLPEVAIPAAPAEFAEPARRDAETVPAVAAAGTETAHVETRSDEPDATPVAAHVPGDAESAVRGMAPAEDRPEPAPRVPVAGKPPITQPVLVKQRRPLTAAQRARLADREARGLLRTGSVAAAEQRFRDALAADRGFVPARRALVRMFMETSRVHEAEVLMQEGLGFTTGKSEFAGMLARLYIARGEMQAAAAVLRNTLGQADWDADSLALLAGINQRLGQHAESARLYERALAIRPREGAWWVGLAVSRDQLGQPETALQAYRNARNAGRLSDALARYTQQRISTLAPSLP